MRSDPATDAEGGRAAPTMFPAIRNRRQKTTKPAGSTKQQYLDHLDRYAPMAAIAAGHTADADWQQGLLNMAIGNVLSIKGGGYPQGGSAAGRNAPITDPEGEDKDGFWPLEKCINAYTTYLDNKTLEIQEQQNARRYRHGAQWTSEQIKTFNDRKQPVVTYNKIGRKIDGIVGLVERLKQDPKAYPRTPQHQAGADLATAVLRYLMDRNKWNEVAPLVNEAAAVDGLAGIELDLKPMPPPKQGGQGMMPGMGHNGGPPMEPDYDVMFGPVDNDGFFYDPRSMKHDFSDARYIGMGKYVDEELMTELMPGMEDDIKAACDSSLELTSNSDRDTRWFQANGDFKQVRLVDIWYKSKGGWKWALFTGSKILMQGQLAVLRRERQAVRQVPDVLRLGRPRRRPLRLRARPAIAAGRGQPAPLQGPARIEQPPHHGDQGGGGGRQRRGAAQGSRPR